MFIALWRTIFLYCLIVFGLRFMGKRQLGELQPADFVITILISNIASVPIENTHVPLISGIFPILALICLEIFASDISLKFRSVRKLISGNPRILIRDGQIDQKEMKNLRFSLDDLMEELRSMNIFDIRDVSFAVVETNGKLSVYQRAAVQPATMQAVGQTPAPEQNMPPVVLITDGQLEKDALCYCGLDYNWLEKILKKSGYHQKDIFLMTCNRARDYYIVPKEGSR